MNTHEYSIGIVTYHARFETYFKPLIKKLARIFPDKQIICILNGHPDRTLQITYLKKAVSFLETISNVRYLTYDTNQSLSKCWNQLVILSDTPKILILNDDTDVSELFRTELDSFVRTHDTFTLNQSWSHFVISKETIKAIGWFEERFPAIGQEDADYTYRMAMQKNEVKNINCNGLRNFVATQENPSWTDLTKTDTKAGTRYAEVNKDFFNKKWRIPANSPETQNFEYTSIFNGLRTPFSLENGMETPVFYDFSVLNVNSALATQSHHRTSGFKVLLQKIIFPTARKLVQFFRNVRRQLF